MKKQRPVHLDLQTIRFPATAIASILHRISGVIMLFAIGILLWLLNTSLSSSDGFAEVIAMMQAPIVKLMLWGILTALGYHLLAGIRHLVMELGEGEELSAGLMSAKLTFVLAILLSIIAGFWLW
ncbi:succinate dehydrogenase, cytochrome b556 subunit [Shewanella sp. NFH-SH190041]|uniref:succinate dehydrogenase, cytochrome b556 subunit n=1 Tax=Shewanella sp. NFH-SH190041 TaxID=2950245 RepID=UPI0039659E37